MQLASVWTDIYGSVLALHTGRAGGYRWVVSCAPLQAQAAAQALARLDGKGRVLLLVAPGPTPLRAALEEQRAGGLAGVLVLDRELRGGPQVTVPPRVVQVEASGLSYREGGLFPAWQDALTGSRVENRESYGECAAASVCAGLGLPVRVCAPERLEEVLREWWTRTPHRRVV